MRSKKTMYNIVSNLLLQVVIIIYGFIVPKIIISNFGSNVNGLISSITQFLGYITLLEAGFGPVVKAALYKPIAKNDKKTISNILRTSEKFFRLISYAFIIYLVGLSFLYPLIINGEFGYFYTLSLIVIISISTFAEYYFGMTYRLYLQADQKGYVISSIQIITYIVSIIIILVLVKLNFSIHLIKLFSGLIFVLRPLLQNYYVKKKYDINLKLSSDNFKLKQKWDGLAQHIAAAIHNNTDIAILTFFCSLGEVSVYSTYCLVVKGIKSIIQAFTSGIDAIFGDMLAKNEKESLNKNFSIYELFYFTISTIFYTCTLLLIVPFIKIYTKDIVDVNYIRPLFGYLLILSEFVWAIRLPYISLTYAAGHFNETRKGAWGEAITNIALSIILVIKYGIVGVTIGTLVAMTIRTIEFIYHTNKYILKRNIIISIKKVSTIIMETIIIVLVVKLLPIFEIRGYFDWIMYAIIVFAISTFITITINILLYKNDGKGLIIILKNSFGKIFHKRRKKQG